jgi:hypothetical protein
VTHFTIRSSVLILLGNLVEGLTRTGRSYRTLSVRCIVFGFHFGAEAIIDSHDRPSQSAVARRLGCECLRTSRNSKP